MTHNVGTFDRAIRAMLGVALLVAAMLAPLAATLRFGLFGSLAGYLMFSALAGSCLGYRLIGRSTCPTSAHP